MKYNYFLFRYSFKKVEDFQLNLFTLGRRKVGSVGDGVMRRRYIVKIPEMLLFKLQ